MTDKPVELDEHRRMAAQKIDGNPSTSA